VAWAVVRKHGTRSAGRILLPWGVRTWLQALHKVGPGVLTRWLASSLCPWRLPGFRHIVPLGPSLVPCPVLDMLWTCYGFAVGSLNP
jgi:hypothetical protein